MADGARRRTGGAVQAGAVPPVRCPSRLAARVAPLSASCCGVRGTSVE
ncbi:hypothetical protein Cus16_0816 [Curtobacterium sp. ER1/6]|nr:hypothetical protein Cus16_0816 [Curtobacterium sp. ER1/6]